MQIEETNRHVLPRVFKQLATVWTQVAAGMAEGLRNLLAVLIQAAVLAHGAAVAQANASATHAHPRLQDVPYITSFLEIL